MKYFYFYDLLLLFVVCLCFFDILDFIGSYLFYYSNGFEYEIGSVFRLPFLLVVMVFLFFYRFRLISIQRETE